MTTTAYDDKFASEPESVRQPYDTGSILRRNVADLEIALKQQTERAEAADEKLTTAREDMQSWIDSQNGWMERAGAAEAELLAVREDNHSMMLEIDELRKELAKLREQKPVAWINLNKWTPSNGPRCVTHEEYEKERELLTKLTAVYAAPIPAPAAPAPEIPDGDDFNGTTPHLIQCIEALVRMNDRGVLVPHGIGGHARTLLLASANRLRQQPAPVVPEEWRNIVTEMVGWWDDKHMTMSQGRAIRDKASALLQSAGGGE